MAKGKYAKKGSGKGGLILLLIITMLVIGGCIIGILVTLNKDKPTEETPNVNNTTQQSDETEGNTQSAGEDTTVAATEATTVPTEETTSPTEETTIPVEIESLPETQPNLEDVPQGVLVAQTALGQVGKPYQSGGNGPDGFDTTGLVFYCLQQNGLATKRLKLKQLVQEGTEVPKEELQPGDVVFFWTSNEGQVEYAGIYIGDGKFVAARNEQNPVSEMDMDVNYFATRYLTARRFGN